MSPPEPGSIRVLCVDDNPLVARALQRRIAQEPGLEWAGCVGDGDSISAAVRAVAPHVVLMDIDMPGVDTFAIAARLVSELPSVRIIMFSGHVRPEYIDRAMDAGAWGYLSKNEETAVLIDGIRRVAAGEFVLSHEVQAVQRATLK